MKTLFFKMSLLICFLTSCNTPKLLFEKEDWWGGHWESVEKENHYFSSGQKRVKGAVTPQFFFSSLDTIESNPYVENLIEFDYKKRWKVIKLSDGQFLKIQDVDPEDGRVIEIIGPAKTEKELDKKGKLYVFKENFDHPKISDSLLNPND